MENKRGSFKGSLGFVLAAAGSAVGLGNIWRFPYLAAKDNGGFFILCYIILALTFGFALLITEIALGRKTKQSPLTAYGKIHKGFNWLGTLATIVPVIILPYYCAIGGWVIKYFVTFATGKGVDAAGADYFTGHITSVAQPLIFMAVFLVITAVIIPGGVDLLKEVDGHAQVHVAHALNGQAHGVLAGVEHTVLAGAVVLEFQQAVAIGQSVDILGFAGVEQFQVFHC